MKKSRRQTKRVNYRIGVQLLAELSAIATIEGRTITDQIEFWIARGVEQWRSDNPDRLDTLNEFILASPENRSYLQRRKECSERLTWHCL